MGERNVEIVETVIDGVWGLIKIAALYAVMWFFVSFANASWNPLDWVWWAQLLMALPFIFLAIYFIADHLPDSE